MKHDGAAASAQTDTSPAATRRYLERLRQTPPALRLARALKLSAAVRAMTMADVKKQHPGASANELAVAFVHRVYGAKLAERLARQLAHR